MYHLVVLRTVAWAFRAGNHAGQRRATRTEPESHVRTPIDAKRLADFLAKIEAYEAVLLQRQRDIENQIVVYHIEQKSAEVANTPQPVLQEMLNSHRANDATLSRFAPIDLTTLQVYEEFR